VWRFGLAGLVFSLFFEGLKFYGFGNLWLMESMAVYPTVFLFGCLIEGMLLKKWPQKWESVFLGFCSFLVVFNLVPLWPWLAVAWLLMLFKNKQWFLWLWFGALIPTIILFFIISPVDWFRETINYNVVYAMPRLSVINTLGDWLKIILFPLLAYTAKGSYQAKVISWLFSGLVIASLLKKRYWLFGFIYLLLVLANLRSLHPEEVFYGGFHLLPWMGMLLMGALLMLKQVKNRLVWLFVAVLGIGLLLNKNMPYFWQTEPMAEYQVNFSRFDDLNWVVKQMVKPGDRLAVLSSESLIYWQTGVLPATRQVVYYAWEHDVPRLKQEYQESFYGDDPPEFIYGSNEQELVKNSYTQLGQNENVTELYIENNKTVDKNKLETRNFSLIEKSKQ